MAESMDNIQLIIAIITSVFTLVTLIYKTGFKNNISRENQYYNKVLQPYILKKKRNNEIDIVKLLKKNISEDKDYIPKYIFYMIDTIENADSQIEGDTYKIEKADLEKVILYDYLDLYPNDSNTILKISRIINKGMMYFTFFMSFVLIFEVVFLTISGLIFLLKDMSKPIMGYISINGILFNNKIWDVILILAGFLMFGLYLLFMIYIKETNRDRYTFNISKMKKDINKKKKKKLENYYY